MTLDMAALDCDFYAFSGHKLYGPTGIGVLWAREELLDEMPPYQGGGAMIDTVTFEGSTFAPPPQRFEAGTPMITEAIALHAAIDYVDAIGLDHLFEHERSLAADLRSQLRAVTMSRCSGRKIALESCLSRSTGFIRTIWAPYWTKKTSPSGPAITARSR